MHQSIRLAAILLAALSSSTSHGAPLAAIRVRAENMAGNPISTIGVGQDFKLAAYVEDIRNPTNAYPGMWAAFTNITYPTSRVSIAAHPYTGNPHDSGQIGDTGIEWAPYFAHGFRFGDLTSAGLMNGIGSSSLSFTVPGVGERGLFKIVAHTTAIGVATFVPSFDAAVNHDSSFMNPPDIFVADQIQFVGATLTIVPEPGSLVLGGFAVAGLAAIAVRKRRNGGAWCN